jgi:hypothetical protein
MPKFKDTRQSAKGTIYNGWVDEAEARSPVGELFSKIIPLMTTIKKTG